MAPTTVTPNSAHHDHHYQQQQSQSQLHQSHYNHHHHHDRLETPRSGVPGQKMRSMTSASSSSSSSSTGSPSHPPPEVLFQGHLLTKRGMLKGLEKDYYFVMRGSANLYSCKSESLFGLWYKSTKGDVESAASKTSSLAPHHVCRVLRADRAGDAGGSDRGIVVVAAPASGSSAFAKPHTIKFVAETTDKCERWIRALHHVQLTQRPSSENKHDSLVSRPSTPAGDCGSTGTQYPSQYHASYDNASSPHQYPRPRQLSRTEADLRMYASSSGTSSHRFGSRSDEFERQSSSSSDTASEVAPTNPRSNALLNAALANGSSQGNNVLLFVPAVGSAISVSDSKLAQARKQVAELAAQGRKRPPRAGLESASYSQPTQWRYGPPEYALADLEYMKHKEREHESTPLESYVEECCQTFLMEATHKANYNEWVSVRQEYFSFQVNDGQHVSGYGIGENDMFGLLYMPSIEAGDADMKNPRAVLAEAFTDGFPMEVLEVFTQPPQCYFAWRHWGAFTGSYKGVKGDGARLEVRGFGQMQIDANRMLSLRLFFKPNELFEKLNRESARLATKCHESETTRIKSSVTMAPARSAGSPTHSPTPPTRAAPAPTPAPVTTAAPHPSRAGRVAPKSKAELRAEIMGELANPSTAPVSSAARRR